MALGVVSQSRCFGGTQFTYQHQSSETGTPMRFAAFVPLHADQGAVPVVWYLSGLTCTEENFTVKAGAQRIAAELGLLLVAPDTSPRGDTVPGDPAGSYDFGLGAGFYVDATQPPWSRNYRMASYVERELPGLISSELPADVTRQSIMGHSMGGHGALTIAETYALKYWWCSPPRTGIASGRPTVWTARGTGASLCSDRCVRASL